MTRICVNDAREMQMLSPPQNVLAIPSPHSSGFQAAFELFPTPTKPWEKIQDFLPTGTIHFTLKEKYDVHSNHFHASDGCHVFQGQILLPLVLTALEQQLLEALDFLHLHHYIHVTTAQYFDRDSFTARVYLIPQDLPNAGHLFRQRPTNVVTRARLYLQAVLSHINRDIVAWYGKDDGYLTGSPPHPLLLEDENIQSMSEVYGKIASPNPEPRFLEAIDSLSGLRSELYTYQRRSVAKMLEMESLPQPCLNPLYVSLVGLPLNEAASHKTFYLQPSTMIVLSDPPHTSRIQGGLLCEELGTGKTVMILALILATRSILPRPEESPLDSRPVTSRLLSPRHLAREKVLVPSFVDLITHRLASCGHIRPEIQEQLPPHLWNRLQITTPFYSHHELPETGAMRSGRKRKQRSDRTMYLTTATLIVVPDNLVDQWDREISKHVSYPLQKLVLERKAKDLPPAQELTSLYDIVLLPHSRLSQEASRGLDLELLYKLRPCICSRYQPCTCPGHPKVSPLLQIRWKRLVMDEGHVSGAPDTQLVHICAKLSAERRWIVTGTPTTNLLGLSLGNDEVDISIGDGDDMDEELDTQGLGDMIADSSILVDLRPTDGAVKPNPRINQIWRYYYGDLRRLTNMLREFLQAPLFSEGRDSLNKQMIKGLTNTRGPHIGAVRVLKQVMEMFMVRHRAEDIRQDIVLPPKKEEIVYLDLHPYAVKSYNALQAIIALNAVTSQRTGTDYMFHPDNIAAMKETTLNMSQFLFYGISDDVFDVSGALKRSAEYLSKAKDKGTTEEDIKLLQNTYDYMLTLDGDHIWKGMHEQLDVPFSIQGLSPPIFRAWSRMEPPPEIRDDDRTDLWMPGEAFIQQDRLISMRKAVHMKPLISEDTLTEYGQRHAHIQMLTHTITALDESKKVRGKGQRSHDHKKNPKQSHDHLDAIEEGLRQSREERGSEDTRSRDEEITAGGPPNEECGRGAHPRIRRQEKRNRLVQMKDDAMARAQDAGYNFQDEEGKARGFGLEPAATIPEGLWNQCVLKDVRIGNSVSTKLNYILNEVLTFGSKQKFLVFSDSVLSLAHVALSLKLIGVPYLQFTTEVDLRARAQQVMTFETSDSVRVFLMELRHAARGLNLISASRIIFCEPVWKADVELQAIMRAYRIGQTRPLVVKTLAIRDTAEEAMVQRRQALKGQGEIEWTAKDMINEAGMREFIANPRFLPEERAEAAPGVPSVYLDIPLLRPRFLDDAEQMQPESKRQGPIPEAIRAVATENENGTPDRCGAVLAATSSITSMGASHMKTPPSKKRRKAVGFA